MFYEQIKENNLNPFRHCHIESYVRFSLTVLSPLKGVMVYIINYYSARFAATLHL